MKRKGELKRNLKYQLKLFLISEVCLILVIGAFSILEYSHVKRFRIASLGNSVTLAVGNMITLYESGGDMAPFMSYLEQYIQDSPLEAINMSIYDKKTGELMYSRGSVVLTAPEGVTLTKPDVRANDTEVLQAFNAKMPDGNEAFLYCQGVSKDGRMLVHAYLPKTSLVSESISVGAAFWLIALAVAIGGSVAAWVITSHQARNIELLHQFATRAATDREFIPMGDFPSDEIGEISRQVIAIYNSRMQANMRREREHAIALKAIEERNNLKRVLTNNVSHELKTPVGIINSYLEMILADPEMSADQRNYFLSKTKANVDRLISIINDMSMMMRLEDAKSTIQMSEIDFYDMVSNFADEMIQSGIMGDMTFDVDLPPDCRVVGNQDLINGFLSNLTKNALAYSGGSKVSLSMIGKNDEFYIFSFSDNGSGVANEHLAHLFERFYRVDNGRSRKLGGTGLGLSIVKNSINTMGGSVSVRNRKGGGLEFIFTLRRHGASGNASTPSATEGHAAPGTEDSGLILVNKPVGHDAADAGVPSSV